MGVIADLRSDIGNGKIRFHPDEASVTRGRETNVGRIVFAPTRDTAASRATQLAEMSANDDFMALVDPGGRMWFFRVGPVDPKRPNHPNRRVGIHIAVMATNATRSGWTAAQRSTVTAAARVMRETYGIEQPGSA